MRVGESAVTLVAYGAEPSDFKAPVPGTLAYAFYYFTKYHCRTATACVENGVIVARDTAAAIRALTRANKLPCVFEGVTVKWEVLKK